MSSTWEIFRRAWEHGFNVGYLQGYMPYGTHPDTVLLVIFHSRIFHVHH